MKPFLMFVLIFGSGGASAHWGRCDRDDQAELAAECENAIMSYSLRVECLKSAKRVATIEFCSRQFAGSQLRVDCIEQVDGGR